MTEESDYRHEFVSSIQAIDRTAWNRLAGGASPFLRHEFLLALETTGCTSRATGWQPHHACVFEARGRLVAVMPLYLKYNSFGEYVFDWSWADAYQTNGLEYYPKFLTAVPFTPSAGPRVLTDPDVSLERLLPGLVEAVRRQAESLGVSSWHVLFPTEAESEQLAGLGLMPREGCQFHWFNRDYRSFEDFLGALSSRKRKNIRRERESVKRQEIEFVEVAGRDITEKQWKHFYVFYQSTYLVRGRHGYLIQDFFLEIGATMPENLVMILARQGQQIIAAALFFRDDTTLYGRYWGSVDEYRFLHFETCFYQGIEYCIENRLRQFDAGAQGEHKIQRGFEPIRTLSNHWIRHPSFASAIADFLKREHRYVESYRQEASRLLPFRRDR